MRRAARVDANHAMIVEGLELSGCTVQSLAQVGDGCPDLLVGKWGGNVLLEVKDEDQPPSKRELNIAQKAWHLGWRGQVAVVHNLDEALAVVVKELAR